MQRPSAQSTGTAIRKNKTAPRKLKVRVAIAASNCGHCKLLAARLEKMYIMCRGQIDQNNHLRTVMTHVSNPPASAAPAAVPVDTTHLKNLLATALDMLNKTSDNFKKEVSNQSECYVCMDVALTKETMYVPDCGHIMCTTCANKVEACPTCRVPFSTKK